MRRLSVANPFNAPVYYEDTVGSTMDVSRTLASSGEPHGTVITAGNQEAGRGRMRGRSWEMEKKTNLPFSVLLRYPRIEDIPPALTLRTGLAVAFAIEEYVRDWGLGTGDWGNMGQGLGTGGAVLIKWPNDILLWDGGAAKKVAGILAEADGGNVHVGIGVNVSQSEFPAHLSGKAVSIRQAAGVPGDPLLLLELILARLYGEIEAKQPGGSDWKGSIEARLYKKGEQVSFIPGAAGSENTVSGTLAGIGSSGELLIHVGGETAPRSFLTGELVLK